MCMSATLGIGNLTFRLIFGRYPTRKRGFSALQQIFGAYIDFVPSLFTHRSTYLPSKAPSHAIIAPTIQGQDSMPGAAEWKKRSIYQILTDRFATTGREDPDIDISQRQYCGGTWQGIISHLDYVQGMGFDAIWISPVRWKLDHVMMLPLLMFYQVTKNIEEQVFWGTAYHGYWQEDMYSLNPHFGTAADLLALSDALHARGSTYPPHASLSPGVS